jgi:hypothetical protein
MQAANAGHRSVRSVSKSIRLNIRLPHQQVANPFRSLSDAVVVAPGGIGTLPELFYPWLLVQVGQMCMTPITLFGNLWRPLVHWLNEEVLRRGFIGADDLQGVFLLDSLSEVEELIHRIHEDRSRDASICVNFDQYRV